jgi:hypothetical protein
MVFTKAGFAQDSVRIDYLKPLIVSTDLFSPLNASLEVSITEKLSLRARYHSLRVNAGYNNSIVIEGRYYLYKIQNNEWNAHVGPYIKLRRGVSVLNDNPGIHERVFLGANAGSQYISRHFVFGFNFGVGLNEDMLHNIFYLFPIDVRFNLNFGFALYKKPKTHHEKK